jgi:alkylhydroperoxidase family enzyme
MSGREVDLEAVNGTVRPGPGVHRGAELVAFTEAVMRGEAATAERRRLRALLSEEQFVEVAAVIGSFNVVDRIADATGIPLDDVLLAMSEDVRARLDLARFASSANTPLPRT